MYTKWEVYFINTPPVFIYLANNVLCRTMDKYAINRYNKANVEFHTNPYKINI